MINFAADIRLNHDRKTIGLNVYCYRDTRISMQATIGERLSAARKARGWLQAELAQRSGLSQSMISQIESGSRKNPGINTINALEESLGIGHGALTVADLYAEPVARVKLSKGRSRACKSANEHLARALDTTVPELLAESNPKHKAVRP